MEIRNLLATDITEVCEVERQCFSTPWGEEDYTAALNSTTSLVLVAVEQGTVIGFASVENVCGDASISRIAVLPQHRRQGVAVALLTELNTVAKEQNFNYITLEVRESNTPARRLYEKFEFTQFAPRKNYYSNPTEDGVVYTKFY